MSPATIPLAVPLASPFGVLADLGVVGILAAVALVSILVFIHELGHFVFAKLFGVRVLVFSIGFGRRLFGVTHGGTDYRVCLLPIGGFVQMEGADPFMDGGEIGSWDSPGNFLRKPVWQRLLIVSAGPIFNLLLPVAVFTALYMGGEPQQTSIVGTLEADGPARAAGMQAGDAVVEVGGRTVGFWGELYPALGEDAADGKVELVVQRGAALIPMSFEVDPAEVIDEEGEMSPSELGFSYTRPDAIIGVDDPDSPAGRAGLKSFDRVLAVNGAEVESFNDILDTLAAADGPATVRYGRVVDGEPVDGELTLVRDPSWEPIALPFEPLDENPWGLYPSYVFVGEILEDSPAQTANVLRGDRIAGINGVPVVAWREVIDRVADTWEEEGDTPAEPLTLNLVRAGRQIDVPLTPEVIRDTDVFGRYRNRARIGIGAGGGVVGGPVAQRYYRFSEALPKGFSETWMLAGFTVEQVGKLLTGEAAPSKTLGGPLQIFRDAKKAAEEGIYKWARMMGILSISLGIINFLPVPVLDGGQFLFYLVEGIRGRPVSLAVRERAQQIGVLFLVALMLTVLVFDVNRALQ